MKGNFARINNIKSEKNRPNFNADSSGMCWLNFWFYIVNLCKIPFHLIGRTPYFCKELKFSFFESPLQKSNGGSKYENLISIKNHIVWPIKWKGISSGPIICYQKMSQNNLKNFLSKIKQKISNFLLFFQKSHWKSFSTWWVLFDIPMTYSKLQRKPRVMWFLSHTNPQTAVQLH